jgi:hypothetical protein
MTIRLAHWLHYVHPHISLCTLHEPLVPVDLQDYLTINLPEQKLHSPGFPLSLENISFFAVSCLFPEAERICAGDFGMDRARMSQLCPEPLAPSQSPIPRKYHFQSPIQTGVRLRSFLDLLFSHRGQIR